MQDVEDTDTTTQEIATMTLHPDCRFEMNEDFDCPWHHRMSVAWPFTSNQPMASDVNSYACAGCPGCILICTAVHQAAPELSLDHRYFIACNSSPLRGFAVIPTASTWHVDSLVREFELAREIDADKPEHVPEYRFYSGRFEGEPSTPCHVPGDTSSTRSISFARRIIETCNNEHACLSDRSLTRMPTRLLDIRDENVRLVETSDAHIGSDYACLSHCWGKDQTVMLRTTSSNLHTFKNRIPWDTIPRTFQDAIIAARSLGISFLWIDALCIIQNDERDWQHQSAMMADIYENAYLTIAAATSVDTNSGCFTPKDDLHTGQVRKPLVTVKLGDGTTRNMYAMRRFHHSAATFPLLRRGWVCQERILSPRILYFAGKELIWECRENIDCECHGDQQNRFQRAELHRDTKHSGASSWMRVLQVYTQSSLTYDSDIFPALSGIAKAYQKIFDDTYVAGLWAKCLPEMLLWLFDTKNNELDITTHPWRAPSWSWASQNSVGSFEYFSCEQVIARVHSIVCEPSGTDPTGQLAFAHLTLTAKLVPARLIHQKTVEAPKYAIRMSNGHQIVRDPRDNRHGIFSITYYFGLSDPRLAAGILSLDITIAQIGNTIEPEDTDSSIDRRTIFCLLLAKHPDETERWLRVGVLTITDSDWSLAREEVDPDWFNDLNEGEKEKQRVAWERRKLQSQDTFRLFDEAPMQDITIW